MTPSRPKATSRAFRGRLGRAVVAAVVALVAGVATSLVGATPALAAHITIPVYGVSGYKLGSGEYHPQPYGLHGNGYILAEDNYCDGDNGIIVALYRNYSSDPTEWHRIHLVSIRGCGSNNVTHVKHWTDGGPPVDWPVRVRVCKLLPNGEWKDCTDRFTRNS